MASRLWIAGVVLGFPLANGFGGGVAGGGCPPAAPMSLTAPDSVVRRGMVGDVFVSTAWPALRMRVAAPFRYLGHFEFDLKHVAHVDRHVFADVRGHRVQRLIVLQFEGFLPGSSEVYRYPITSPISLGGIPYRHNLYLFNAAADARRDPEAEPAHLETFLREHGLETADEQIMSRFATIVGDDRRHELIIFYDENLVDHGHSLAQLEVDDGDLRSEFAAFGDSVAQRSFKAFTVLP